VNAEGKVWVPDFNSLRERICIIAHTGIAGHRGVKVTTGEIKKWFWWEEMENNIRDYVRLCLQCVKLVNRQMTVRPMGEQIRGERPNEVIHFDYMKMPVSKEGLEYVLVVKDDVSQWVELVSAESACTAVVVETLLRWFARFGIVSVWVTDQGSHFKNVVMSELERMLKVKHHFTTAYSPWANGSVERCNRELLRVMRAMLSENKMAEEHWPELLVIVQGVLNQTVSDRLGNRAPIEVMTGLKVMKPLDTIFDRVNWKMRENLVITSEEIGEAVKGLRSELGEIHRVANETRKKRDERKQKMGSEKVDFEVGDFVLVAAIDESKLKSTWRGPMLVAKVKSEWVYELESIATGMRIEAHVNRIRKYSERHREEWVNWERELKMSAEYDEEPVVEEIVRHRYKGTKRTRIFELEIKWRGFESEDNTWEPLGNLLRDIPARVRIYARECEDDELSEGIENLERKWKKERQLLEEKKSTMRKPSTRKKKGDNGGDDN
jgi:transposase InsO family protein